MIERLPLEVIEILFSLLGKRDLAECQCVNQSWYQRWIQLIYQRVYLRGELQLLQFLNPATPWSLRGQQVRKLIIEKGHVQPETLGRLPTLFPFVNVFMIDGIVLCEAARKTTLHHYQQRKQQEEVIKIKSEFRTWAASLRQLVEFNGITVAHCILTENYCPNLTRLSLQFNNTNDLTNLKLSLLAAFKNIPALEHLSLERIFLDMDELEAIHQHCPNIQSLRLKGAAFLPMATNSTVTEGTKPAVHFRSFECIDSSFCEDVVHWLEYIATKYCHAEILDIGCCRFGNDYSQGDDDILYNNCLLLLASKCRRIKKLKLSSLSFHSGFLNALDRHGICLNKITLGDGLSYLLDHEMKALVESRQRHFISRLVIHGWPTILVPGGLSHILFTINSCQFLTHLVLHMGRHSLQQHQLHQQSQQKLTGMSNEVTDLLSLYQVIRHCSHLTHLSITEAKLLTMDQQEEEKEAVENNQFISKLNSLVIENCLLDHNLFSTLSYNCPQLKHLSISASVFSSVAGHPEIHLPGHSLDLLELYSNRVSRHCSVKLGTSRFLIRTKYDAVCYDLMEFEWRHLGCFTECVERLCAKKVKVVMTDEREQKVYLSVICKSVKQLYLTGLEVIKDGNFLFLKK